MSKGLPDDASRPLRRGLGHREHGLSHCRSQSSCQFAQIAFLPRYLQQRLVRKQAQQRLFRECGCVELTLQLCLRILREEPGSISDLSASLFPPTGSQSSILRRVRSKIISAGPPPVGLSEQEALTELLRCQDLYALQPQHLADYDIDKLRVTKGGFLPTDAVALVSPSLAEVLRHPCSSTIRSSAELLHLEESEGPITPYWDPTRCAEMRVNVSSCFTNLLI